MSYKYMAVPVLIDGKQMDVSIWSKLVAPGMHSFKRPIWADDRGVSHMHGSADRCSYGTFKGKWRVEISDGVGTLLGYFRTLEAARAAFASYSFLHRLDLPHQAAIEEDALLAEPAVDSAFDLTVMA